jgi:hypothetical protein
MRFLATRYPAMSVAIPFFNRNLEPHLDETQQIPVNDSSSDALQKFAMWNGIEVFGQIGIDYIREAFTE